MQQAPSGNGGNNSSSRNSTGNNSVTTGDASVIANIVNFVNNNVIGSGRLFIAVVNVFGSWLGNFVGPGFEKENNADNGIGGLSENNQSNQNNSGTTSNTEQAVEDDPQTASVNTLVNNSSSGVLGLFAGSKESSIASSDEESSDEEIAFAGGGDDTTAGKKVVRVNLAWLLTLLPIGFFYMIIRKRYTGLHILPKIIKGNA